MDSLALDVPGSFDHPPHAKDIPLDFQIAELRHLTVDFICMSGLDPCHQESSLGPIFGQFLSFSLKLIQSLGVLDVSLPLDPNMGELVSSCYIIVEVSDLYSLVDIASPSIKYLEYPQLLNIGLNLILLNFLEIGLSPVPQVFRFLYFPYLIPLLSQNYTL